MRFRIWTWGSSLQESLPIPSPQVSFKNRKGVSGKEREDRKGILPLTSASLFKHASRGDSRCEDEEKELSIKQLLLWSIEQTNCCGMQGALSRQLPLTHVGEGHGEGKGLSNHHPHTDHSVPPHPKLSLSKSLIQNIAEEEFSTFMEKNNSLLHAGQNSSKAVFVWTLEGCL